MLECTKRHYSHITFSTLRCVRVKKTYLECLNQNWALTHEAVISVTADWSPAGQQVCPCQRKDTATTGGRPVHPVPGTHTSISTNTHLLFLMWLNTCRYQCAHLLLLIGLVVLLVLLVHTFNMSVTVTYVVVSSLPSSQVPRFPVCHFPPVQ